ncbi:hypothetical protein ITP31_003897 [Salmonella enterica]|nr:hypothetical protein [Salmonella enterica]
MDVTKLKRNVEAVLSTLAELPDGALVTKTGCVIHVPESFRAKQLISLGKEISFIGYFAMITPDGNYCTWKVPSMIRTMPDDIHNVEIDGKMYYELHYPKGARVAKSTDLLVDQLTLYPLFEDVIARARTVWYYTYEQMGSFFSNAREYTGTSLYATPSVFEMVIAQQARDNKDRNIPIRHSVEKPSDVSGLDFTYIPMRNVEYGATDTVSKIGGSNIAEGIDSAIVNPTEEEQPVEKLLRV